MVDGDCRNRRVRTAGPPSPRSARSHRCSENAGVTLMFRLLTDRRLLLSAVVIASLFAVALWPSAVSVELARVSRGPLVVTIDEEGRTRVRDRFIVTAPVTGRVLRIELEPGDRVARGDVVARLQ